MWQEETQVKVLELWALHPPDECLTMSMEKSYVVEKETLFSGCRKQVR